MSTGPQQGVAVWGTLEPLPTAPTSRLSREERAARAATLAELHDGVVHRRDLRHVGISRADVRSEVNAGRWTTAGRHTVVIGTGPVQGRARLWWAIWESGSGAVLDGASALIAVGLKGFEPVRIDVTLPHRHQAHQLLGVRVHLRRALGPVVTAGLPRVRPEHAVIRGAEWARSDREAALLLCLTVQQRLVHPDRLRAAWQSVRRSPRRAFLEAAIKDICDGAHSLGELDFTALCRAHGLPAPSRQVVRTGPKGRIYLDVAWEDIGLVVEIDGGHHALALNPIDDALRQNDVVLTDDTVLRIPVLGLRLQATAFMEQVARGHRQLTARMSGRTGS